MIIKVQLICKIMNILFSFIEKIFFDLFRLKYENMQKLIPDNNIYL